MGLHRAAGLWLLCILLSIQSIARGEINPRLAAERNLVTHRTEVGLRIVGERFIDPQDWAQALKGKFPNGDTSPRDYYEAQTGTPPYYAYGQAEFESFLLATQYVQVNGESRLPTIADYLKLHELAYGFPGSFAVKHALAAGDLTDPADKRRATMWLNRNQSEKLVEAGLVPARLGVLREKGWGRSTGPGGSGGSSGGRHRVNADELRIMQSNPMLQIGVVASHGDNTFDVTIEYPPGEEVRSMLTGLFSQMESDAARLLSQGRRVDSVAYRVEALRIASYFYLGLIGTHGLFDGNGRTSKLTRDWLLRYFGLDVPYTTQASDLAFTQASYQASLASEIAETAKRLEGYVDRSSSRVDPVCATDVAMMSTRTRGRKPRY